MNKNKEIIEELKEMKAEVEKRPGNFIKDRLLKAINDKLELFEKDKIETK
jgi:hypothetical protein